MIGLKEWATSTATLSGTLSLSPLKPASHSLWPASSPVARGNRTSHSGRARRLENWAVTPPQSRGWCWCCRRRRHWAGCWAPPPSGSWACSACSGGPVASALRDRKHSNNLWIYEPNTKVDLNTQQYALKSKPERLGSSFQEKCWNRWWHASFAINGGAGNL